jgi:hypothetical protein
LADDFKAILSTPAASQFETVMKVLENGPPIEEMRPFLREMALCAGCPLLHRQQMLDAWVSAEPYPDLVRREIFEELGAARSDENQLLRYYIALDLPASKLSLEELKSVLLFYLSSFDENRLLTTPWSWQRPQAEPRPDLFDELLDWHLPQRGRNLFECMLADTIRRERDLEGRRLRQWVYNVAGRDLQGLSGTIRGAVKDWIEQKPCREIEIFDELLSDDRPVKNARDVIHDYYWLTERQASAAICDHVLDKYEAAQSNAERKRLRGVVVFFSDSAYLDYDAYWKLYERVVRMPRSRTLLKGLTLCRLSNRRLSYYRSAIAARAARVKTLAPRLEQLRTGKDLENLHWGAMEYLRLERIDQLISVSNAACAAAIKDGWQHVVTVGLDGLDLEKFGEAQRNETPLLEELPAILGLNTLIEEGRLPELPSMPMAAALVAIRNAQGWLNDNKRLERFAIKRLNLDPVAGAAALHRYWKIILDAGGENLEGIELLKAENPPSPAIILAVKTLLASRRNMHPSTLKAALEVAIKHCDRQALHTLSEDAVTDPAVLGPQRAIWRFLRFGLDPESQRERFLDDYSGADLEALFRDCWGGDFGTSVLDIDKAGSVERLEVMARLAGKPKDWFGFPPALMDFQSAIQALGRTPDPKAGRALLSLERDPALWEWRLMIQNERAYQSRVQRDSAFRHPTASVVLQAIAGGPPVNANDLRHVAMEELTRLKSEIRRSDVTPWKRFWNLKGEKAESPLPENQCRDYLLDRLRDRLQPYGIAAGLPEARRSDETRADMLILTGAGRNLPLEAKRHYNPAIWRAAATQLQGYAADPSAEGFGIYVVFWFGNDVKPTPARPDGTARPMTAGELEQMLLSDLPGHLRSCTDVVVFDVSKPDAKPTKQRSKRVSKVAVRKVHLRSGEKFGR